MPERHDPALTILDRLDGWKAAGAIDSTQHAALAAIARRERVSLFVELNALLYLGVISVVAGLVWTFREYVVSLGDVAILSILGILLFGSFGYAFTRGRAYSNQEVESPSLGFDYVVYFGCLIFSAALAFVETRFAVFQGWATHLLIAAFVFGGLAYRFDNRFVLSLSLSTLAGYLGLRLSAFDAVDGLTTDRLRAYGALYGGFLLGTGSLLYRQGIKRHFLEVYLQLGVNAVLLAAISGVLEPGRGVLYLGALLVLCAAALYLGVRFQRFAFVAYGTLYGYAGVSAWLLSFAAGITTALMYFIVTGAAVVAGLVVLARRFGRNE